MKRNKCIITYGKGYFACKCQIPNEGQELCERTVIMSKKYREILENNKEYKKLKQEVEVLEEKEKDIFSAYLKKKEYIQSLKNENIFSQEVITNLEKELKVQVDKMRITRETICEKRTKIIALEAIIEKDMKSIK